MTTVPESQLRSRLSKVKLLVLDVDGVLTDGGLYYTDNGEELKKFNVKDGQGIELVLETGVEVAIVTGSSSRSTSYRAQKLGVSHVLIQVEDKLAVLTGLSTQLDVELSEIAYMGDDLGDLAVMRAVGCPVAVADAVVEIKECAIYTTRASGGHGAVRELCDLLVLSQKDVEGK